MKDLFSFLKGHLLLHLQYMMFDIYIKRTHVLQLARSDGLQFKKIDILVFSAHTHPYCFASEDTDSSTGVIWITIVFMSSECMYASWPEVMVYSLKSLTY